MVRIHMSKRWLGLSLIAAAGVMSACTTTQGGAVDESTANAQQQGAQQPATEQVPEAKVFGPEKMLRDALVPANLTADQQKTIDAAIASAHESAAKARQAGGEGRMKPLFAMAAEQIRSGKIDETALDAKITELAQNGNEHHARMAAVLQTVHDTLTPDQRATVAASLEQKISEHDAVEAKEHEAKEANEHEGKRGEHHGLGRLGFLLHGVDLQDGQLDKIKAALKDAGLGHAGEGKDHAAMEQKRAEMKQRMGAMLEAFKSDTFDAKTALPDRGEMPGEHLQHMAKVLTVVVPLLDETQRAALAKNIENGPEHPMWRNKMHEGAPAQGAE